MPEIPEVLTFEQIQHRFAGEWVLIAEWESDDNLQVLRGQVLVHSHDRDRVYNALGSFPGQTLAIEYVGNPPADWAIIL